MFDPNRYLLWESDYPAALALFEMLAWFEDTEKVELVSAVGIGHAGLHGSIVQHTYSRGFITERVMSDFWSGLCLFLEKATTTRGTEKGTGIGLVTAKALLESIRADSRSKTPALLPQNTAAAGDITEGDTGSDSDRDGDHTEMFLKTLHGLNDFTRAASSEEMKPVKEMYRDLYNDGKELVEWWTTVVCDLDLIEEVHDAAIDRKTPWSEIMSDLVAQNLDDDSVVDDDPVQALNNFMLLFTQHLPNTN